MTKYTAFRCPVDLLEKAKKKAASQRRSLSNYLVTLLEKTSSDGGPSAAGVKFPKTPVKPLAGAKKKKVPAYAK